MAENGNGSTSTLADFIWKNAEDLWGNFKHTDFGKIILPFTLLRRLECVLEPTREKTRTTYLAHKDSGLDLDLILRQTTRYSFYNTSEYALATLGGTKTRQNLLDYVAHFSDNASVIFEQFDFRQHDHPARQGRVAVQDLQKLRRRGSAPRCGAGSGDEQSIRAFDPSLRCRGQ